MINLQKLFEIQKALDERIVKENNITHDRFDNLVLALLDEVGECAKETRCFKDWSKKGPSPREVILEEYVDGVHFVLSLGLLKGYDKEHLPYLHEHNIKVYTGNNLTAQFLEIYVSVSKFAYGPEFENYEEVFLQYLGLGRLLGFTDKEIEVAYMEKNEVNHQRQKIGY
ncbi:dUTP diphosphatase [Bacillus mycoides]|uniref:dUTP diphosphatase n=1 Tax=Bacillus mycoides TaxID=1405 RepID=UPI001C32CD5E|nr:dUTP diphosphatase [Bacillus mycoides]QWI52494.1 dUTPase [Bacillus mycoides]